MPKVFTSDKQKIGKLGEELAKRFLMKHGYSILEENYTKKYGEIDLIAKKDDIIHFIEVKSIVSHETKVSVTRLPAKTLVPEGETIIAVSHETLENFKYKDNKIVPRETNQNKFFKEEYDPIQNLHPMKLRRLSRVIQVYLLNVPRVTNSKRFEEIKWQFDLITVKINNTDKTGIINHIKDIII